MVPPVARMTTCGLSAPKAAEQATNSALAAKRLRILTGFMISDSLWALGWRRSGAVAAYSNALSLGAFKSFCMASEIGKLRFRPLGGMGWVNHFL